MPRRAQPPPRRAPSRRRPSPRRRWLGAACGLVAAGATIATAASQPAQPATLRTTTQPVPLPPAASAPLAPAASGGVLPPLQRCAPGAPGCRCEAVPRAAARACWHALGGRFGDGACATPTGEGPWRQGGQCCAGAFAAVGACGPCRCRAPADGDGCVAAADATPSCAPEFAWRVESIDAKRAAEMRGVTWRPGCPVALADLRVLHLRHFDAAGHTVEGELVVAATAATPVRRAFARLYRHRFPVTSLRPMEAFGGDDDRSMAVDNTSAFNCRPITGGTGWSEHAFGRAIDLNPLRNPYVRGTLVLPPAGLGYQERAPARQGTIVDPGPVVGAFRSIGWGWGGAWRRTVVDYQHLSSTGR